MYDSNSFPMLFIVPNYHHQPYDEADVYSSYSSSSSSPDSSTVDCTLSLGTPSTRLSDKKRSSFCGWNNLLKPNKQMQQPQDNKNSRVSSGGDSMLARRCASCDTTSTPLWRNGPRGPKSLCNACGIRYKKEERRATATASTTTVSGGAPVEHQYILNNSWAHQNSPIYPYYSPATGNEFSFMDGTNHAEMDNGIPFISWGLNVADRPSFVHY